MPSVDLQKLRQMPWMTDEVWRELCGPSWRKTHVEEIGEYLRADPTNGRQLVHAISHRLEKTVERLLSLGASADEQAYGPCEASTFHPLDRAVSISPYPWSERIADMVFHAGKSPFSLRGTRPLLSCAIELPEAVAWCLSHGADPDEVAKDRYTALAASAMSSDKHTSVLVVRQSFRLLLAAGAQLDTLVPHPNASAEDPACMSAAACAIWAGRWPLAKLLLARGADLDIGGALSVRALAAPDASAPAARWVAGRDASRLDGRTPLVRARAAGVRL